MAEPVVTLFSDGLLSKWGFGDGDTPEHVLDYCDDHGVDYSDPDWHAVLTDLVRRYLLPALDQNVVVTEISTNHNPIRAKTIDGVDVTDHWYEEGGPSLTPEFIEVPLAEVIRVMMSGAEKP